MNTEILFLSLFLLGSIDASASEASNARQMFRRLDANDDRAIQFSEIGAARAALFDRLDADRDGSLDIEEVRRAANRVAPRRDVPARTIEEAAETLSRMDVNSDGRISRREFSVFVPDRVRRADANGDEELSLRELRALRRQ